MTQYFIARGVTGGSVKLWHPKWEREELNRGSGQVTGVAVVAVVVAAANTIWQEVDSL